MVWQALSFEANSLTQYSLSAITLLSCHFGPKNDLLNNVNNTEELGFTRRIKQQTPTENIHSISYGRLSFVILPRHSGSTENLDWSTFGVGDSV